jgi:MEDS: MEthanogen/methylotroph, DcmR Sensory domain
MREPSLEAVVPARTCEHLAVLLRSEDELPSVLASFYALGARRGGWLVHRALPGEGDADRARLAGAGLAVETLEAAGHLLIEEFDPAEAPEHSTDRWEQALDEALGRGYSALWYSRFAVGRDAQQYATVLLFEEAWDACFRGRPVVTLCPYIVGELGAGAALDRLARVAELHRGVLVQSDDGLARLSRV